MRKLYRQPVFQILVIAIWVNISETIRWLLLIEPYWLEKYQQLGIEFPKENINLLVWMLWGFVFALIIYAFSKKYDVFTTTIYAWIAAFVMTWLVLWNVGILPTGMLWINIPLSLFEAFVGALICKKLLETGSVNSKRSDIQ